MDKHPQDIKYIFKQFPLQNQAGSVDYAIMTAAVQEVSTEAFWLVHDYLYTDEGQALTKGGKEAVKQKIEQIIKESGFNVQAFQNALESGKGKKRVDGDVAAGMKIRVGGTPTTILNGFFVQGPITEKSIEGYLKNPENKPAKNPSPSR